MFEARHDDYSANGDARAPSPISRARPQTSSDHAPAPVSMHARGTKRSAEADEFELRLELAPGNDARINEEGGMIGAAKVIDTMAGLFAYGRTKLQSWLGSPTPHRDDAGDASPKRVKLSDDGHSEASDSGSVRWKSKSVNGGATPRLPERKWPADSSRPHKPSTAERRTRPLATEDAPPTV
ncbi:hypothetical protein IMZ48_34220, partial [Candidatus Bathyarchaeota archaeon]|nr:hypothetical protein [Candidatus Bathyarchaeota archaeon]